MNKESIKEQLIRVLKNGEKSPEDVKLGIEIEHLVVRRGSFQSVTYYEPQGIETLLGKLKDKGYLGKYEGGYLVGLSKGEMEVTLEPGGQLEFSTRPCIHLAHIEQVYDQFLEDVLPIVAEQNQYLLGVGYHPQSRIEDIPFNPKKRYEYMSEYLHKRGKYALNMMKGTASIQVAIDYVSEADFIRKFRVANFLTPLFYLITDNAPIFEGEIYRQYSLRTLIWEHTDPRRSGIIKGALDKAFTYEDYAEYLLHSEPICVLSKEGLQPVGERSLWEVYQDADSLSQKELEHLYTMVFPDVRGKNYIEIRMADSMPRSLSMAYLAMIKGLFYDQENLMGLYELSLSYDDAAMGSLKEKVIAQGYRAPFDGGDLGSFGNRLISKAEKALEKEEKSMLAPLKECIRKKETYGQRVKAAYEEQGLKALEALRVTNHQ